MNPRGLVCRQGVHGTQTKLLDTILHSARTLQEPLLNWNWTFFFGVYWEMDVTLGYPGKTYPVSF